MDGGAWRETCWSPLPSLSHTQTSICGPAGKGPRSSPTHLTDTGNAGSGLIAVHSLLCQKTPYFVPLAGRSRESLGEDNGVHGRKAVGLKLINVSLNHERNVGLNQDTHFKWQLRICFSQGLVWLPCPHGRQGGREAGRQGGRQGGRQAGRQAGRQGESWPLFPVVRENTRCCLAGITTPCLSQKVQQLWCQEMRKFQQDG